MNDKLTLKEIKDKIEGLRAGILEKIKDFENETGLYVDDIEIFGTQRQGARKTFCVEPTIKIQNVPEIAE